MIKIGQVYRDLYDDDIEYEVKTFVDNYIIYKEKTGKITAYSKLLFSTLIEAGELVLIKDVEDTEKLEVISS